MVASPYVPVSFTSESITQQKFQQMANNEQWLFENAAKIRYNTQGVVRDTQIKVIAGKSSYVQGGDPDGVGFQVYFGSFFSASCKPVVVATSENTLPQALIVQINGLGGELDYRGFNAHIQDRTPNWPIQPGWVHWIAVGF